MVFSEPLFLTQEPTEKPPLQAVHYWYVIPEPGRVQTIGLWPFSTWYMQMHSVGSEWYTTNDVYMQIYYLLISHAEPPYVSGHMQVSGCTQVPPFMQGLEQIAAVGMTTMQRITQMYQR